MDVETKNSIYRGPAQLTIFSIPKAFRGPAQLHQENAIRSWLNLQPFADVLLIGDEPGTAEFAAEVGARHISGVATNNQGTPLLSSAFELAHRFSSTELLAYCNCDVILFDDFIAAGERLLNLDGLDKFLAIGRRLNCATSETLRFDNPDESRRIRSSCLSTGTMDSVVCKEYFVFPRTMFESIPGFAVGRGNWDNWMVRQTKRAGVPVIDLSQCVLAIHQKHDYSRIGTSRWNCYVAGVEARENQRLAGGRHLISGSTATWRLTEKSLYRNRMSFLNWGFWRDFPRFAKLIADFIG